MEFNSSITQAAAKAMEHLTDFVFITMGGGSWQPASRLVNNGVDGFVPLVRLLAVPYWPPGRPKHFLILLFYTS